MSDWSQDVDQQRTAIMHRKTRSENFGFLGNLGSFGIVESAGVIGGRLHTASSPSNGQELSREAATNCSMDTDRGPGEQQEACDASDDITTLPHQQHVDRRGTGRTARFPTTGGSHAAIPAASGAAAASQATDSWSEGPDLAGRFGLPAGATATHSQNLQACELAALPLPGELTGSGVSLTSAHGAWRQPCETFLGPSPFTARSVLQSCSVSGPGFMAGQPLQGFSFTQAHTHVRSHSYSYNGLQGGDPGLQPDTGSAHDLTASVLPSHLPLLAAMPRPERHPSVGYGSSTSMGPDLKPTELGPGSSAGEAASGDQDQQLPDVCRGAVGGLSRSRARGGRAGGGAGSGEGGEGEGGVRGRRDSAAKDKQRGSNGKTSRELLLLDPKRVRRIIANRMSAAKSKERKQQYTEQLEQMLDDAAAEREGFMQQLERLRVDGQALESYTMGVRQETQQVEAQLVAVRQQGEALLKHLCAARVRPAHVDASAAAAAAAVVVPLPQLAELLTEALSPEDMEALEQAGQGQDQQPGLGPQRLAALAPKLLPSVAQVGPVQPVRLSRLSSQSVQQVPTGLQPAPSAGLSLQQQPHLQDASGLQQRQQALAGGGGTWGHHRPTQSADAATMMCLVSQLGFPGAIDADMAGELGPAYHRMPEAMGRLQGGAGVGVGSGLGAAGLPVAGDGPGKNSLSLPGPMDMARHRAAAEALAAAEVLAAAGGQPVTSSLSTSCAMRGSDFGSTVGGVQASSGGAGGAVAMDLGLGLNLEQLGVGLPRCVAAGDVGGGFPLAGGAELLGAGAHGGGGGLQPQLQPSQPFPGRQVTTALRPPVTTDTWRQ